MAPKSPTKNKKNSTPKPSGQAVPQPETSDLDKKAKELHDAHIQAEAANLAAFVDSKVIPLTDDGGLELLDITSIQNTLQKAAQAFVTHAAADGSGTASFFLAWTKKQKKRLVVVIGRSECRIWSSDESETWEEASGRGVVALFVTKDALRNGGEAIMAEIGHGITHIVDTVLAVDDVSDNGRHKQAFADRAKTLGLEVKKVATNKKFVISGLSKGMLGWLESSTVNWSDIIAWGKAQKATKSGSSDSSRTATSKTSAAAKAKKAKALKKAKLQASNSTKFESLMARVESVFCPTKGHHAEHGLTLVAKGKVHVCPVQNKKNDPAARCLKVMVTKA